MKRSTEFDKYHGAGNDFILIDDPHSEIDPDPETVRALCDRHFGIGADGLILTRPAEGCDYEMVYYNSDGNIGSMCGNGARCCFTFAQKNGYVGAAGSFKAYDGLHEARALEDGWVEVSMRDVDAHSHRGDDIVMDTGSPHYIRFVDSLEGLDVVESGRLVRYSEDFKAAGINVNFVVDATDRLRVSTYERGVEDRTLACGTGATAVALAYAIREDLNSGPVKLRADGGDLEVDFLRDGEVFKNVVLRGPAVYVFSGEIGL